MWKNNKYQIRSAIAAETGERNLEKNIPCQDSVFSFAKNNIDIVSLADGAGSCKHSDIGSNLSNKIIANFISDNFDELYELGKGDIAKSILDVAIKGLNQKAVELQIDLNDLSSTLLFIASNNNKILAGHIGDGMIVQVKENKSKVLSTPETGEFLNSTYFLTTTNAQDHLRIYKSKLKGKTGFVLMSDGTAESLYIRKEKTLARAVTKLITWLDDTEEGEQNINNDLSIFIKENLIPETGDDCSIALLSVTPRKSLTFKEFMLKKVKDILTRRF